MSKLTGWQIIKTTGISGPKSGYQTVYEHKGAAEFIQAERNAKEDEWCSNELVECPYEMLNATKCDANGQVATLDRTTRQQLLRWSATRKLSEEERQALHIPSDETLAAIESLEQRLTDVKESVPGIVRLTSGAVADVRRVFKSILGK